MAELVVDVHQVCKPPSSSSTRVLWVGRLDNKASLPCQCPLLSHTSQVYPVTSFCHSLISDGYLASPKEHKKMVNSHFCPWKDPWWRVPDPFGIVIIILDNVSPLGVLKIV